MLEDLVVRIDEIKEFVSSVKHRKDFIAEQRVQAEVNISGKRDLQSVLLQVVELFKRLGGDKEEEVLAKLDIFVSYGLSYIFGEEYSFKSGMRAEGKDVKVDFFVIKDGNQIPLDQAGSCGGGVVEVSSVLMQIFYLVLGRNFFAPLLILDTSFVQVSPEFIPRVSSLLYDLSMKCSIQIVLFTHTGLFLESADRGYRFSQEQGKTLVEKTK